MPSRFFPKKDIDTFDKFNKELVGDLYTGKDGIIYQPVVIYKVSVYDTETNRTVDLFGQGIPSWENLGISEIVLSDLSSDVIPDKTEIILFLPKAAMLENVIGRLLQNQENWF